MTKNESHRYAETIAGMNRKMREGCVTPSTLLEEYGQEYNVRWACEWAGTPRACYANAQFWMRQEEGLRYCEGYAMSVIPVEHAWLVNADGYVIDPTWGEDYEEIGGKRPVDYFGITFDLKDVRKLRKLTGKKLHSLLFTWEKWPTMMPVLREMLEGRKCEVAS